MESPEVIDLLRKMKMDEYKAPDEYEEIIKKTKSPTIKKFLKYNQSQERKHFTNVVKSINIAEK